MSDPFDPERFEPDPVEEANPFENESGESTVTQSQDQPSSATEVRKPTAPEVQTPSAPETPSPQENYSDAPAELKTLFWKLVVLYKFSIVGTTLGALLVISGVATTSGAWLLAGSLVLFGYTLYQTKRGKERVETEELELDSSGSEPADESGEESADEIENASRDEP